MAHLSLKQGCGVGGKISDSDLSKIPTPAFPKIDFQLRLFSMKGMTYGC